MAKYLLKKDEYIYNIRNFTCEMIKTWIILCNYIAN